jgi:hypothetical protein
MAYTEINSHLPIFPTMRTNRHYYHLSVPALLSSLVLQLTHPFVMLFISSFLYSPIFRSVYNYPFKDEAQTALFKDPVRTAL